MYNTEQKKEFVNDMALDNALTDVVFNIFAPYEEEKGKDVCSFSYEEIIDVLSNVSGSPITKNNYLSRLRTYLKWMESHGYGNYDRMVFKPGAVDWGMESTKRSYVGSPEELADYLDKVFGKVDPEKATCAYHCFAWLAFIGVPLSDSVLVESSCVDKDNTEILFYKSHVYQIPEEAREAFRACSEATEFQFEHPKFSNEMRRRAGGNILIRTYTEHPVSNSVGVIFRKWVKPAVAKGIVSKELNYKRISISGFFYKKYLGGNSETNFYEEVNAARKKKGIYKGDNAQERKIRYNSARRYSIEYYNWLKVFHPEVK